MSRGAWVSLILNSANREIGTALGGWWACPYTTILGSFYAVMNGAPGFDGSYNFGFGKSPCTEFEVQIKPIGNVEC